MQDGAGGRQERGRCAGAGPGGSPGGASEPGCPGRGEALPAQGAEITPTLRQKSSAPILRHRTLGDKEREKKSLHTLDV